MKGSTSRMDGEEVSTPNSDGMKCLMPEAMAASIMEACWLVEKVAIAQITAS